MPSQNTPTLKELQLKVRDILQHKPQATANDIWRELNLYSLTPNTYKKLHNYIDNIMSKKSNKPDPEENNNKQNSKGKQAIENATAMLKEFALGQLQKKSFKEYPIDTLGGVNFHRIDLTTDDNEEIREKLQAYEQAKEELGVMEKEMQRVMSNITSKKKQFWSTLENKYNFTKREAMLDTATLDENDLPAGVFVVADSLTIPEGKEKAINRELKQRAKNNGIEIDDEGSGGSLGLDNEDFRKMFVQRAKMFLEENGESNILSALINAVQNATEEQLEELKHAIKNNSGVLSRATVPDWLKKELDDRLED